MSLYPPSRVSPGYSSSTRTTGVRSQSNVPTSRSSTYGGAGSSGLSTYGGSYGGSSQVRAGSRPAGTRSGYQPGGASILNDYHGRTAVQPPSQQYGSGTSGAGGIPSRRDSFGRSTPTSSNLAGINDHRSTGATATSAASHTNRQSAYNDYSREPAFERSQTSTADDMHHHGGGGAGMHRQYSEPSAYQSQAASGGENYADRLQSVYDTKVPSSTDSRGRSTATGMTNTNRSNTPLLPSADRSSAGGSGTPRGRQSATTAEDDYDYYASSDAFKVSKSAKPTPPTSSPVTSSGSTTGGSSTGYAPQIRGRAGGSSSSFAALPVPFGFRNLGNTCYLNATLQCIIHTAGFVQLCAADPPKKNRAPIVEDMKELLSSSRVSTGPLLSSIKNKTSRINAEFSGFGQNDGHEFLRAMLMGVHDEINRARNAKYQEMKDIAGESDRDAAARWGQYHKTHDDSSVYDVFGGLLRSVTKCLSCGYRSLTFDPILDVSVPLVKESRFSVGSSSHRMLDLLHSYSSPEDLTGTNKYHCAKCKTAREAKRQTTISAWPKTLVIHLKRFSQTGSKNGCKVLFKERLEVPAMMAGISDAMRDQPESRALQPPDYRLRGVVIHHGTSSFGHYTSYVYNEGKKSWFYCDDSSVRPASIEDVLAESSGAYILFYEAVGSGQVADRSQ